MPQLVHGAQTNNATATDADSHAAFVLHMDDLADEGAASDPYP